MATYVSEDLNDPEKFFQVKIYNGTGSSNAITLDGNSDMAPNLVWFKRRNSSASHEIYDSVRGVNKFLYTDDTHAEDTNSNGLSAFSSNGFTVAGASSFNASGGTSVAWCWAESATSGFDIVSFSGNQTARTISHSLSAKPEWMWIKNREKVESWHMYHSAAGATKTYETNTNNAFDTSSGIWNDTDPTTSVFTVGNNGNINETGSDIIVYLWAAKQGFSRFGSYYGNNLAAGNFVYCGFKPALILIKEIDGTGNWVIQDKERINDSLSDSNNGNMVQLYSNVPDAEDTDPYIFTMANGFKNINANSDTNAAGKTYAFMAFAEAPLVNSKGVPANAQ